MYMHGGIIHNMYNVSASSCDLPKTVSVLHEDAVPSCIVNVQ